MEPQRLIKQLRKVSRICAGGLTLSAIRGRFIGPKVLANSIPKAGTNVLQEVVHLIPLMRGKVTPTWTLRTGSRWVAKRIASIRNGQCVPAHISYDEIVAVALKKYKVHHILIVRDFRDVILSNIHYLDRIHRGHPHNAVFSQLRSLDEKIHACLVGLPEVGMMAWPELVRSYRPWATMNDVLVIRYENLLSGATEVAEEEIKRIVDFLGIDFRGDISRIRKLMLNPNGLTFNAPGTEKWRSAFSSPQIKMLNDAFANDLEFFGYKV